MTSLRYVKPLNLQRMWNRSKRVPIEVIDKASEVGKQAFEAQTSTWNNKPSFQIKKKAYVHIVYADHEPLFYLNEGTRVRYATMTPNFQAKTAPNRFRANKGRGGKAYVSTMKPREGIKARNFDEKTDRKIDDFVRKYKQPSII